MSTWASSRTRRFCPAGSSKSFMTWNKRWTMMRTQIYFIFKNKLQLMELEKRLDKWKAIWFPIATLFFWIFFPLFSLEYKVNQTTKPILQSHKKVSKGDHFSLPYLSFHQFFCSCLFFFFPLKYLIYFTYIIEFELWRLFFNFYTIHIFQLYKFLLP